MEIISHSDHVQQQFGEQANAYLSSAVHAEGAEFAQLRAAVAAHGSARVLDLGCGAGHISFQIAVEASQVVAYDLSSSMLEVVAAEARRRQLSNLITCQGPAESLPFGEAEFDFVFSRYSAHHWSDIGLALREVRRVLKPGGQAAFIDVLSPGQPLLDTHLQAIELLRDTSHVRDYSAAEWLAFLAEAGLFVQHSQQQQLRLEFASWLARMRTPAVLAAAIGELQAKAAQEVRDYFAIESDGSFSTEVLVVWARK
ncbi:methyltransferase domain-containing protein [Neisseriaceae bacterium TC5R-5]|nr:methyltransferase domain-containing protein [Neisseriaceae bacterium TC5R-5]